MLSYLFIHLALLASKGDTLLRYRQNPLLVNSKLPYQAPEFDKIIDLDYKVAIDEGIKSEYAEIHQIAADKALPTFNNTLVALEKRGQLLNHAYNVFNLAVAANSNDFLQKLAEEESPKITALNDAVFLNDTLYQKIIYVNKHHEKLDSQSKFLLHEYLQNFLLAGIGLNPQKKAALRKLNYEEAVLGAEFNAKLLKSSNHSVKLENTTQQNALSLTADRDARQQLFEASYNRAERSDSNDTRNTIESIAKIRAEKAHLLGYQNYADWQLKDQMAGSPKAVDDFLRPLINAAAGKARQEAAAIQQQINKDGHFQLKPWDWNYYAEQIRKTRYQLDDSKLKPYFELRKVLTDGIFYAANQLYGISFKERKDIPVYHPDVMVFEAFDSNQKPIGLFYFDYFKRDNKNGGAWENHFTIGNQLLAARPVIYNVANFTKPVTGPTLLTYAQVITMFHEFGHGLHALFSNCEYPSLSGTNVARDYVEFPSQFNERWALNDKVLEHYAIHYGTGQPMPKDLVKKLKASTLFNQGYALTEALADDAIDMTWHELSDNSKRQQTDSLEKHALQAYHIPYHLVPPRYRSSYFAHIWVNGYAAGYYAYEWTDMLADDAYDWFEKHGGLTRKNGERFKRLILSKGHTANYTAMFRSFYGKAPSVKPLLTDRGLN